jgi:DNA-binding MarR family transcriptional regulator
MTPGHTRAEPGERSDPVAPAARRAGLGAALRQAWVGYRRRLDDEMAAAGFADHDFPDGRVLRICSGSAETTISQIGRELSMTRQGAGKLVASLRERRYVTLTPSATDGREKIVALTPRAVDFLHAQRRAARQIEHQLLEEVGAEALSSLYLLLDALGGDEQPRLSDYLRQSRDPDDPRAPMRAPGPRGRRQRASSAES